MKLQRFKLHGFAQHEMLDISFRDGQPNLVLGPNEAGKSHLMAALTGTLVGIPDPEGYIPWHSEPVMTGYLSFQSGEDSIEIERRFLEQQVDVSVNGEQVYHGRGLVARNTTEDERYRSLLHQWIGFAEHDVFSRTVFVGQDQMHDARLGDYAAQFKRLISGTSEANYETAIEDLEEELDTLVKLPGKRVNRRLEDLQETLHDLETRHRQAEQIQQQVVELVEEERSREQQMVAATETRDRYHTLIERYHDLQETSREEDEKRFAWKELQDQINRLNRINRQRLEYEQKRDELRIPGDPEPGDISGRAHEIERLRLRIEHLEEAVARNRKLREDREFLESELERLRLPGNVNASDVREIGLQLQQSEETVNDRQHQLDEAVRISAEHRMRPAGLRMAILAFVGVLLAGSIALGTLFDPLLFAGAGIALIVLIIEIATSRQPARHPSKDDPHAHQIQLRRQELQTAVDTLKSHQERRNKLLAASRVKTLHELFDRARQYNDAETRLQALPEVDDRPEADLPAAQAGLEELEVRQQELLQSARETDVDRLAERAAAYWEAIRFLDQLEEVDPEHVQSLAQRMDDAQQDTVIARRAKQRLLRNYPELEDLPAERVSEFREAAERAEQERSNAERRLQELRLERQHLGRDSEDAEALRLRIKDVREQIDRVELQAEAHKLAISTLQASVKEFQDSALVPVSERAGHHMQRITGGRYQQVTLDRETMTPTVAGNGQTDIALDRLSRGARDQLYLSIRAALIDALSGDRSLPMLLDDPCVNFDEDRLASAAHLLEQLAAERQILLFTKDETWTRWFEPVLRLG